MPKRVIVPDRWRKPTDTEARLLKAGVCPKSWTHQEARNWLWRHGLVIKHLAKEGTVRGERLLRAYAAWSDVLDPSETPSKYRQVSFVPNGGKTGKKGHPFNRPVAPVLGMPAELTETELQHRASRKLREITRAFRNAPINARDLDAMSVAPSPFKSTQRLYPCGRMWLKCSRVPDAQEIPMPSFQFTGRPVIKAQFLSSICSRVLQWCACNPHATPEEIGKGMGLSVQYVDHLISRLTQRGLLKKVHVFLVSPTLIGEDRLFTHKDKRSKK